jgi:hypothetical protein
MIDPVDRWSWHCKEQIRIILSEAENFNDEDVIANVEGFMFEMIQEEESTPEHLSEILSDIALNIGPDAHLLMTDCLTRVQSYLSGMNQRAENIIIRGPAIIGQTASTSLQDYHADSPNYPDRFLKE